MIEINIKIFQFLNNLALQYSWLDTIIVFLATNFGIVFLIVLFIFLIKKRNLKAIIIIFSSAIIAWILAEFIKYIISMPRPFILLENVKLLFEHGEYDSFPSAHATFYSAIAVASFFFYKKIGLIAFLIAIIIGLARIVSGIHFPIDILVGFILGIITAYILYLLTKKL